MDWNVQIACLRCMLQKDVLIHNYIICWCCICCLIETEIFSLQSQLKSCPSFLQGFLSMIILIITINVCSCCCMVFNPHPHLFKVCKSHMALQVFNDMLTLFITISDTESTRPAINQELLTGISMSQSHRLLIKKEKKLENPNYNQHTKE